MKTLREWRAAKLHSSKTLSAASGVSNKTILDIENGKQTPTFRTIGRLSQALGVEPGDIAEFAAAIETREKPPRELATRRPASCSDVGSGLRERRQCIRSDDHGSQTTRT